MSGLTSGVIIFIIIVSGVMGFIMITNEFQSQYTAASIDPVNNTGILLNNTSAYYAVQTTSDTITANLPIAVFMGLLLVALVLVLLVFGVLKK